MDYTYGDTPEDTDVLMDAMGEKMFMVLKNTMVTMFICLLDLVHQFVIDLKDINV